MPSQPAEQLPLSQVPDPGGAVVPRGENKVAARVELELPARSLVGIIMLQ